MTADDPTLIIPPTTSPRRLLCWESLPTNEAFEMDLVKLRGLVGSEIQGLTIYTHRELAEASEDLGLPKPPDEKSGSNAIGSTRASMTCQTPICRWWRNGFWRDIFK
jgi:hypothetical protein